MREFDETVQLEQAGPSAGGEGDEELQMEQDNLDTKRCPITTKLVRRWGRGGIAARIFWECLPGA